jgi:purine-binding chemotaxis protein CheW
VAEHRDDPNEAPLEETGRPDLTSDSFFGEEGGGGPEVANDLPFPSWLEIEIPDLPKVERPAAAGADAPPEGPVEVPTDLYVPRPAESAAPPPGPAPAEAAPEPPAGPAVVGRRPFIYGMVVRNPTARPIYQTRVEHELPRGVRYLDAEPRPEARGRSLVWALGNLGPGESLPVRVRAQLEHGAEMPTRRDTSFRVSYDSVAPLTKPRLQVQLAGKAEVLLGDAVLWQVHVLNPGSGLAAGVRLQFQVPPGLHHARGDVLDIDVGALAPGQKKRVSLRTSAQALGQYNVAVTASSADGLRAGAQRPVRVVQPALALAFSGPARCVLHGQAEFYLEVSNPGTAPATRVRVAYEAPAGMELQPGHGGAEATARGAAWSLDALPAGEKRLFPLRLTATAPGDFAHRAAARAERGASAEAEAAVSCEFDESATTRLLEDLLASIDGGLRREGAAAAAEPPPARRDAGEPHVVFSLAGGEYAVPLGNVVEVGRPLPVTPVPNVPDWVLGVANVRGDIVSMVHLRSFLGLPRGGEPPGRLVVARAGRGEMTAGLLVDRVRGIRALPPGGARAPEAAPGDRLAPYLRGVAEADGRLLAVLDLDRLLLSPELRQFEEA